MNTKLEQYLKERDELMKKKELFMREHRKENRRLNNAISQLRHREKDRLR